ncbi:MAG: hypothetical protein ACTSQE_14710 [Candidatus Heimdallarchaeaceae archaeon]
MTTYTRMKKATSFQEKERLRKKHEEELAKKREAKAQKLAEAQEIGRTAPSFSEKELGKEGYKQAKLAAQAQVLKSQAQATREAEEARRKEAKAFLEERGFFEEAAPERVSLAPEERLGGQIPVAGGILGARKSLVPEQGTILNLAKDKGWIKGEVKGEGILIETPETLREQALNEIQKEVIKEGLSAGERFGSLVEGIPVIGSLASKYATGLIEDPKGNIETIVSEIASERERASVLAEKVATGKISPYVFYEEIDVMEENIAALEQRIKLLINSSPALRVNADKVHRIEEQILRAKERIYMAKQLAAGGMVVEPTDTSIYFELEKLKSES